MIILCPLEFERRALQSAASAHGWTLVRTGPGAGPARWLDGSRVPEGEVVVLAGVAAGLTSAAGVGTAWAAGAIVEIDSDAAPRGVLRPSFAMRGVDTATFAWTSTPLLDAACKARAAARTGAQLADMECAPFARAAEQRGVRWAVVRGVSDGALDEMPAQAFAWTNAEGRTRVSAVACDLLRAPALLPRVVRLGQASVRAMRAVALALATAHNAGLR